MEDMWAWLTEVPPQYLYTYSLYNGTRFAADYKNNGQTFLSLTLIIRKPEQYP